LCQPNADSNRHSNTDSFRNAYGNLYTYSNGDAYSDGDAYCYRGAEVYSDAKASSYGPSSAPISLSD
jgi:hypothetical protein